MTMVSQPAAPDALSFREVCQLPRLDAIHDRSLFAFSLSNNTTGLTHGLHRFPAKYIPQVPGWALDEFTDDRSVVLDPFMGSGTTLVEGLVRGGLTIGLDIDPLAKLIARAKTDILSLPRMMILGEEIRRKWPPPAACLEPPMPGISGFGHWFNNAAWGQLQSLLELLLALDCSEQERRFLLVVFSSIVRAVSNADDQSHKTYVSGTFRKSPPNVAVTFWRSFQRALTGLSDLEANRASGAQVEVLDDGEACRIPLPDGSVDLIVTSPPYLDSVDYMYNFMLEYFWLAPLLGVPDRSSWNARRRRYIGSKCPYIVGDLSPSLYPFAREFAMLPLSRRRAAATYFDLMGRHFAEASRCLRLGARYVMVVGNSQSRVNVLPVHECLARLAADSNLTIERVFGYRVRRHYMKFPRAGRGGIILIDWVIVARKTTQPVRYPQRLPNPWVTLSAQSVAH